MAENRLNYGKKISNMGYIAADGLRRWVLKGKEVCQK